MWEAALMATGSQLLDNVVNYINTQKANEQAASNTKQAGEMSDVYLQKALEAYSPYINAAQTVLPGYTSYAMSDQLTPGFGDMIAEGTQSLMGSAASQGKLKSSQSAQGLSDYYSQALADEYAKQYEKLAGLSDIGASASSATGQAATNTGNTIVGLLTGSAPATSTFDTSSISSLLTSLLSGTGTPGKTNTSGLTSPTYTLPAGSTWSSGASSTPITDAMTFPS